jgi:hypothetical protein
MIGAGNGPRPMREFIDSLPEPDPPDDDGPFLPLVTMPDIPHR